jgi:GNAT superfamily N-acetyltransferase
MGEASFSVRRATRRDLPALGRLGALLLRTHYDFDRRRFLAPRPDADEGYAWFLGSQLDCADALVLVAEQDDVVVGYAHAGVEPMSWKELRDEAGFVHDVCVDENARGEGIGTALLEAATNWLRERGVPRVVLWTAAANIAARRLFERVGFRHTMLEMTREL